MATANRTGRPQRARYWRAAFALALAAGIVGLAPAGADAAAADLAGGLLVIDAQPGEGNQLTLSMDADNLVVADVVPLDVPADPACSALTLTSFSCVQTTPDPQVLLVDLVDVDLGDLDDTFTNLTDIDVRVDGGSGADTLTGGGGNDEVDGGSGGDDLSGGAGSDTVDYSGRTTDVRVSLDDIANDGGVEDSDTSDNVASDFEQIRGGAGDDVLKGSNSDEEILGNGGDDILTGLGGPDVLSGGPGSDTAGYQERTNDVKVGLDDLAGDGAGLGFEDDFVMPDVENVAGGAGNDWLIGSADANQLDGGPGDDTLEGSGGPDVLNGDEGDDQFVAGADSDGADVMSGGAGVDEVTYAARTSAVTVVPDGTAGSGGSGAPEELDQVDPDIENLVGGAGNDTLTGLAGANRLTGGTGNDLLAGGSDDDVEDGGPGDDRFSQDTAPDGADVLVGGPGTDTVSYAGRTAGVTIVVDRFDNDGDTLSDEGDHVGTEMERLVGGSGGDVIRGGSAPETLVGGEGADLMSGGPGTDTATYADRTATVAVTIDDQPGDGAAGEGDNVMTDVERLLGGSAGDRLTGSGSGNDIAGGGGGDTIDGAGGADLVVGQGGNDTFVGGTSADGADRVAGGSGIDTMTYAQRSRSVSVALDDLPGDGQAGEGDNVGSDVENVRGGGARDFLDGSDRNNRLDGGAGNDDLDGGDGDDRELGGSGADFFSAGSSSNGADQIVGGTGSDTVSYAARRRSVIVRLDNRRGDGGTGERDDVRTDVENVLGGVAGDRLFGNGAANLLDGGAGSDQLSGGRGDDLLSGRAGHDVVTGEDGDDLLFGHGGNDDLFGRGGDDQLSGGPGRDDLFGGPGADSYVPSTGDHVVSCSIRL